MKSSIQFFKIIYLTGLFVLSLIKIKVCQPVESTVQPFLPEIIKQFPNVRDIAMSSNGNEIYFSVQSYQGELSAIVFIKKEKDKWSKPMITSFSGKYQDLEPFLSIDGLRLYFSSNRPLDDISDTIKDYDIWYVERKNVLTDWSSPINIGEPINTENNEFFPSLTRSNNMYFTSDIQTSTKKDDIYFSKWKNNKYEKPMELSDSINSIGYEFNAFVSPDENYIIFSGYNRLDGNGSGDLYISYHLGNDNWTNAINLGKEINSPFMDYCPFVDTKSNTLYFTGKRNKIKPTFSKNKTIDELQNEMNKYENGLSRLYKINIEKMINK